MRTRLRFLPRAVGRLSARVRLVVLVLIVSVVVSCGIEVYAYLYPVIFRDGEPSDDLEFNRYKFRTSDNRNTTEAGPYFKGFDIYYRIYTNSTTLASNQSSINSYNSNTPALAYNYLLNTKEYRRLVAQDRAYEAPLIPGDTFNRLVEVRFFDYDTTPVGVYVRQDIPAETIIDDFGPPMRSVNGDDSSYPAPFDFDDIDSGDDDVSFTTWDDDADKKMYVHAYVLAYGFDSSFKQLYSELYELGIVTIPED